MIKNYRFTTITSRGKELQSTVYCDCMATFTAVYKDIRERVSKSGGMVSISGVQAKANRTAKAIEGMLIRPTKSLTILQQAGSKTFYSDKNVSKSMSVVDPKAEKGLTLSQMEHPTVIDGDENNLPVVDETESPNPPVNMARLSRNIENGNVLNKAGHVVAKINYARKS